MDVVPVVGEEFLDGGEDDSPDGTERRFRRWARLSAWTGI